VANTASTAAMTATTASMPRDMACAAVRGWSAMHGRPAVLHLEDLWIRNVTITTGLVDTSSTPTLLRMLASGRLDASRSLPTGSVCMTWQTPTTCSRGRSRPVCAEGGSAPRLTINRGRRVR
jgi:hypothetical protein